MDDKVKETTLNKIKEGLFTTLMTTLEITRGEVELKSKLDALFKEYDMSNLVAEFHHSCKTDATLPTQLINNLEPTLNKLVQVDDDLSEVSNKEVVTNLSVQVPTDTQLEVEESIVVNLVNPKCTTSESNSIILPNKEISKVIVNPIPLNTQPLTVESTAINSTVSKETSSNKSINKPISSQVLLDTNPLILEPTVIHLIEHKETSSSNSVQKGIDKTFENSVNLSTQPLIVEPTAINLSGPNETSPSQNVPNGTNNAITSQVGTTKRYLNDQPTTPILSTNSSTQLQSNSTSSFKMFKGDKNLQYSEIDEQKAIASHNLPQKQPQLESTELITDVAKQPNTLNEPTRSMDLTLLRQVPLDTQTLIADTFSKGNLDLESLSSIFKLNQDLIKKILKKNLKGKKKSLKGLEKLPNNLEISELKEGKEVLLLLSKLLETESDLNPTALISKLNEDISLQTLFSYLKCYKLDWLSLTEPTLDFNSSTNLELRKEYLLQLKSLDKHTKIIFLDKVTVYFDLINLKWNSNLNQFILPHLDSILDSCLAKKVTFVLASSFNHSLITDDSLQFKHMVFNETNLKNKPFQLQDLIKFIYANLKFFYGSTLVINLTKFHISSDQKSVLLNQLQHYNIQIIDKSIYGPTLQEDYLDPSSYYLAYLTKYIVDSFTDKNDDVCAFIQNVKTYITELNLDLQLKYRLIRWLNLRIDQTLNLNSFKLHLCPFQEFEKFE